jgi:hypothetical protein
MLRKSFVLGVLGSLGVLLPACGSDSDGAPSDGSGGGSSAPMLTDASSDTQALWTQLSGYTSWPQFPEGTTLQKSESHSNMFVRSFYNDMGKCSSVPTDRSKARTSACV